MLNIQLKMKLECCELCKIKKKEVGYRRDIVGFFLCNPLRVVPDTSWRTGIRVGRAPKARLCGDPL
jgi:hypothetical protein